MIRLIMALPSFSGFCIYGFLATYELKEPGATVLAMLVWNSGWYPHYLFFHTKTQKEIISHMKTIPLLNLLASLLVACQKPISFHHVG